MAGLARWRKTGGLRLAQGLGLAVLAAWGTQSCKSPKDAFECNEDVECDLASKSGTCEAGRCVYAGDGSGGSTATGGDSGSGGNSDSGGKPGGNGGSGNGGSGDGGGTGTGGTADPGPDGGTGDALTVAAGTIGGKGTIDGIASFARFVSPSCLAFDGKNYIYVGDAYAQTVRRLDIRTAEVKTIAGYAYDQNYRDDKGSEARFSGPECVTYDSTDANNPVLYVSEWDGHRIRKIALNADYTVTTIAGSPSWEAGFIDGVGTAAKFHSPIAMVRHGDVLYVADAYNHALRTIDLNTKAVATLIGDKAGQTFGSTDGPVASARLEVPHALALDPAGKRLFIGEFGGGRIRVLNLTTNVVSTLLPNGSGGPVSMVYDAARHRLIAGMYNDNKVLSVDTETGSPTLIAGSGEPKEVDGPPRTASFLHPHGIALAPDGAIYVADTDGHTIRKLVADGAGAYQTTTFAGRDGERGLRDAKGAAARFWSPGDMALAPDGHTVYVVDGADNCAIRTFDLATKQVGTLAGGGACASVNGTGVAAQLNGPGAMAMGVPPPGGKPPLFVAEQRTVVRKVDTATGAVTSLNTAGDEHSPRWHGIAATATTVYVTGEFERQIFQIPVAGGAPTVFGGTGDEGCDDAAAAISTFKRPGGLLWDGGTKLFVADQGCGTIRRIDLSTKQVQTVAGGNQEGDENPDGTGENARFFFPDSMQWDREKKGFYVSDMHVVRYVDAATFDVKTIVGEKDEEGGVWLSPSPVRLNFPGGFIEGDGGELFITSEGAILQWVAP